MRPPLRDLPNRALTPDEAVAALQANAYTIPDLTDLTDRGRTVIHALSAHGHGADWDLDAAINYARRASARAAYTDGPAEHDLVVTVSRPDLTTETIYFNVPHPDRPQDEDVTW